MTQRPANPPTRNWTRSAGRAITYGPFARAGDWWSASRDARTLLATFPEPAESGAAPPGTGSRGLQTPRTIFLGQLGRGRAEKEWLRYRKETAGQLIALAQARADRDAARRRLDSARQARDGLTPPGEAGLEVRRSGEQRTDPTVVAARRLRAFAERQEAAEASVRQLEASLADAEAEVTRLEEPVRVRFEVAKTRADLIDAYVRRRRAYYLTRLLRKQPEAGRTGPLVQADWPEQPAWVSCRISPDLARDQPLEPTHQGGE